MNKSKEMRVLQVTGQEHAEVVTMPVPALQEGQVLVKILAVVTCNQFDLHIYEGRPMLDPTVPVTFPQPPGFPGHEWVGEVVELGPGVTKVALGDWVCTPGGRGSGPSSPQGAYGQYRACHESILLRVPAGMDPLKLAPMEMASCVASNILDLKPLNAIEGRRCGVSGLGPAGLIAAQMLRAEGAEEVIGVEISPWRRDYALEKGIVDRAIDPLSEEGKSWPTRKEAGSIELTIDCAGAKAAVQYMMDHTREIVSLFAVQREPYTFAAWYTGLHQGLKLFGHVGRDPRCGEYALRRVKNGSLDLSLCVSHKMALEAYNEALGLLQAQQALKICFFPNGPVESC